jgi:hypothetical protein
MVQQCAPPYSSEGVVEFVEVTGGSGIEVLCFGFPVFATDAESLMDRFMEQADFQGRRWMQLPSGALDIALWRPDTEGPETNSSLRLVCEKGCYA